MMMTKDVVTHIPLRLLFSSDHHFGAPTINQEEMTDAFSKTIFPLLSETDVFFINGDFFDTLVIFDNHGFDPIYDSILKLFSLCDQYKVTLRILQGTWMHDRNQLRRFVAFYRNSGYTFNFKFIEGIELETILIHYKSLRIMYVPDDLPFKSSGDVVDVITSKMTDIGWDYIDYGCMHGFFDFTFPERISQENRIVYKESQFPFVRKMIDVGHVHQHRIRGKVISNGSFDRLCFGDEDPKGCVRVLDYSDYYTAHFVQNKDAAIFNTLVFTKEDDTETIRTKIKKHLDNINSTRKISLRFIVDILEHREAIKSWMKDVYPDVRCVLKKSGDAEDRPTMIVSSDLFVPIEKRVSPTPKTISTFVRAHISEDYVLTTDAIDNYLIPMP